MKAIAVGAVVLSVGAVVALAAFRHPQTDPLGDTDAYYVLASPGGADAVEHLNEWLPSGKPLLVSTAPSLMELPHYQALCADQSGLVLCAHPEPFTTQGEARNLGRVAREQGWRSVTVISHRSHLTRARILMNRCFDGEVRMVPRNVERGKRVWLRALVYESGAMVKTVVMRGC